MTSEEKELISTIKIAVIRGIVFADEEKLLELIKTAVGSNMSEKPTGSTDVKINAWMPLPGKYKPENEVQHE